MAGFPQCSECRNALAERLRHPDELRDALLRSLSAPQYATAAARTARAVAARPALMASWFAQLAGQTPKTGPRLLRRDPTVLSADAQVFEM